MTMICLRLRRLSAPFGCVGFTSALLLVLLATAFARAPESSAATPRSRTRRVAPALAPLHYTERSFAVPRTRRAGAGHDHASSAGAKSRARASGAVPSRRRGHNPEPEPVDRMPMHRAARDTGRGGQQLAHARSWQRNRIPLPAPDPVVAEVTGRSSHGDYLARLHAAPRRGSLLPPSGAGRSVVVASNAYAPSYPAPQAFATQRPVPVGPRPAPEDTSTSANPAAPMFWNGATSTGIYASGTSRPDDDRLSPRIAASRSGPGAPSAGSATSSPAKSQGSWPPRSAPVAPAQVVDGFGSELALAPAMPSDHPGTTRRRNHPIPASALPEDTRPAFPTTLEDRDAITAAAVSPAILPEIYGSDGRLVMPAPLKGSREVLAHQNTMADSDGLERIGNDAELNRLRASHQLVDLPVSNSLRVNDDLPYNRRAARPWTALFTQDIARDYYARFHQPLWVTSAVRTVAFQSHLIRVNGNAAGLYGDFASPHLTGQAIDFGKGGMSAAELAWMRSYLLPLIQSGKIDVEEEFQQACFHISVYRRYAGTRRLVNEYAQIGAQIGTGGSHTPPAPPVSETIPPTPPTQEIPSNP